MPRRPPHPGLLCVLLLAGGSPAAEPPRPAPPAPRSRAGEAPRHPSADPVQAGQAHWRQRARRAELEAALTAWDEAVTRSPGDVETLVRLSRAAYLLGDGYLKAEGDAARLIAMHERGAAYALRALQAGVPALQQKADAGAAIEEALTRLDRSAVPALFWYALNLRSVAEAQGTGAVVRRSELIKKMMEACIRLDEGYFFGGAHRYLGVFYARAPWVAGGDMGKSKKHFQRALEIAPGYLATRVLWAEFYAVKKEDRPGFERELRYVLEQPDDVLPDATPENLIEKARAKALLEKAAELF